MKKILLSMFTAATITTAVMAQGAFTPNGCPVPFTPFSLPGYDPPFTDDEIALMKAYELQFNLEILGPATRSYNCHGYAWHVSEGGAQVYIGYGPNAPNHPESIYWEDGSYEEIFIAEPGAKAVYMNDNHSAVVCSDDTDYFISKWGDFQLVRHHKYSVRYNYTQIRYFRRVQMNNYITPSEINGSGVLINPETYSLGNLNPSWSVMCEASDNIVLSATTGISVTASRNWSNSNSNTGWIKATIITNCSSVPLVLQKNNINTPGVIITGDDLICVGASYTFKIANAPQGFYWEKSANLTLSSTTASTITVTGSGNGTGWVRVMLDNVQLIKKTVWVGIPDANLISSKHDGNYVPPQSCTFIDAITYEGAYILGGNTHRIIEGGWQTGTGVYATTFGVGYLSPHFVYETSQNMSASFYYGPIATIDVRIKNCCGWSGWKTLSYYQGQCNSWGWGSGLPCMYCGGLIGCLYCIDNPVRNMINNGISIFSNPVNDILTIEINPEVYAGFNNSAKAITKSLSFYLRLYDTQGNLLRQSTTQGGTVQFNVSNLPNGIYYLHIYDGVNEKPGIRQIIVEH